VYNQCANEVLRYAVKSHRGLLADDDVPKDIYDKSRLPSPPRPGDIDAIVAGFPWCVSQVELPRQLHPLMRNGT
jgi:DNA (cytosine-5)-methyltransferase 1